MTTGACSEQTIAMEQESSTFTCKCGVAGRLSAYQLNHGGKYLCICGVKTEL